VTSLADELDLSAADRRAFAETERLVGGVIVKAESQGRWRPAWFLELDRDGETLPVYFRGDRGLTDHGVYTLEHELRVLQVLEAEGIPVPHVYGFCEEPRGIVMERSPGRANLATEEDPDKRSATLDHYMEILVAMHRIPVERFEAIGLRRPADPDALGLVDLPVWVKGYRQRKQRPEPLIELLLGWLERNVPTHRDQVSFIVGDAGQFVFDEGRVTAVLDLELACLGDPLADLGGMRNRDISEPLGDLSRGFRRYAELTEEPIDIPALHYHTVRFGVNTPLACAYLCADPPLGINLAQYLGWNLVYARLPVEVIAEVEGVDLERPSIPEPRVCIDAAAHDALVAALEPVAEQSYEGDVALRMAQYARELDRRGPRVEAEDLEEASKLVGRPLASWAEADTALEDVVNREGEARLPELLCYFYRRTLRHEALLRPAMRELTDIEFQTIRL
jgi:aminoglycoside phosphotransferase (APT) family kinase protein